MVAIIGLALIILMRCCPQLPAVRTLKRWLVDLPTAWIAQARRHHLIAAALLIAMLLAPEALMLMGTADLSLFAFALDASLYIDALVVTMVLATVARFTPAWHALRALLPRPRARSQRVRARRTRKPASNDEDGPAALSLAA